MSGVGGDVATEGGGVVVGGAGKDGLFEREIKERKRARGKTSQFGGWNLRGRERRSEARGRRRRKKGLTMSNERKSLNPVPESFAAW